MASTSEAEQPMKISVVSQDGQVIEFKIKKTTPFRKLMSAYCDRTKLAQNTVRFTFDGSRINDGDTPKSMDMEDGDTIEVFTQQTGGSVASDATASEMSINHDDPAANQTTERHSICINFLNVIITHLIINGKSNKIINNEYIHYDTH